MTVTALAYDIYAQIVMETEDVRKSYPGKGLIRYNARFTNQLGCNIIVASVDYADTLFPRVKFRIMMEPGQTYMLLTSDSLRIGAVFARP